MRQVVVVVSAICFSVTTARAQLCPGDIDHDGRITVADILTVVVDGAGVNDVLGAVNGALGHRCDPIPTRTPSRTHSPTTLPTRTPTRTPSPPIGCPFVFTANTPGNQTCLFIDVSNACDLGVSFFRATGSMGQPLLGFLVVGSLNGVAQPIALVAATALTAHTALLSAWAPLDNPAAAQFISGAVVMDDAGQVLALSVSSGAILSGRCVVSHFAGTFGGIVGQ